MRKKMCCLLALVLMLWGCGRKMPEPTLMTVPETEPAASEPTLRETHPDTPEYYIKYVYPGQLREYYSGLTGRWDSQE